MFDILEGITEPDQEPTCNSGTAPNKLEHCLGRVTIDGRRASAPLILKLEITFEVGETGSLVVLITDSSNNRVTRLQVGGDETCLSTEAVALAQAQMSEVLKSSVVTDPGNARKPSQGLMVLQNTRPVETLRAYVEKLKPMVLANGFAVCILPGDLFLLRTRIENASTWLEQLNTSQPETQDSNQTAREYLRQIHTLHLSSTVSGAYYSDCCSITTITENPLLILHIQLLVNQVYEFVHDLKRPEVPTQIPSTLGSSGGI